VFRDGERDGATDAGVPEFAGGVLDAVQAGCAPEPEIAVERCPEEVFHVVAKVPFKSSDGSLVLCGHARVVLVLREELGVGRIEPCAAIGVDDPVSPTAGESEFGFECPPVVAEINQLGGIVLSGGGDDAQTESDDRFLFPLAIVFEAHGGAADKIDRDPIDGIEEAGAIDIRFRSEHGAMKIGDSVGNGGNEVGTPTKKVHGVVIAEDGNRGARGGIGDGNATVEVKIAGIEAVSDGEGVGVNGSDDISARCKVLRAHGGTDK